MTTDFLEAVLRLLVQHFGYEPVVQSLRRTARSNERASLDQPHGSRSRGGGSRKKEGKGRRKPAATEYVSKLVLSDEDRDLLMELAERFQEKSFLPTVGDIRDFCEIHGVGGPASRSRVAAVPRVFGFLAAMNTDDLRRVLDSDAFSGPAQLGPIADAIREAGRARREGSWGTDAARSMRTAAERR